MNPEYEQIARLAALRAGPQVPPSVLSRLLGDILGIQSQREQGVFPFSRTPQGAGRATSISNLAAIRNARAVADSSQTMPQFENFMKGGGY